MYQKNRIHNKLFTHSLDQLQEQLEKASEELASLSQTDSLPLNVEYLIQLMKESQHAMSQCQNHLENFQDMFEEKQRLQEHLKTAEEAIMKMHQENQELSVAIEEIKSQLQTLAQNEKKKLTESIQQCEENLHQKLQNQLAISTSKFSKKIEQQSLLLNEKDQIIASLHAQLLQTKKQNGLLKNELQLAQIALHDLSSEVQPQELQLNSKPGSRIWQTYSPTPNHSSSQHSNSSEGIKQDQWCCKRTSLMQDLCESQLTYASIQMRSQVVQSQEIISETEIEDARYYFCDDKFFVKEQSEISDTRTEQTELPFQDHVYEASSYVYHKQKLPQLHQEASQSFSARLFCWFKKTIVDSRIKKR